MSQMVVLDFSEEIDTVGKSLATLGGSRLAVDLTSPLLSHEIDILGEKLVRFPEWKSDQEKPLEHTAELVSKG